MSDISLDPRAIVAMAAIVVACLTLLVWMGNPEPALPRCQPSMPAAIRCAP